jgi:YVTN family beta-propeller protein
MSAAPRPRLRRVLLVMAIALITTLGGSVGAYRAQGHSDSSSSGPGDVPHPGQAEATPSSPSTSGPTVQTLDLENGTIFQGNYVPPPCTGYSSEALAEKLDRLFVTCNTTNDLLDLNLSNRSDSRLVPVGGSPEGVVLDPSSGGLFVSSNSSKNLTVVSSLDDRVLAKIPLGASSAALTLDTSAGLLYVAEYAASAIAVVSVGNDTLVGTISLPANSAPDAIAYDSANGGVYVGEEGLSEVAVYSAVSNNLTGTIPVAVPISIACDPLTDRVYVGSVLLNGSAQVVAINGSDQLSIENVSAIPYPDAIAVSPATNLVYVAAPGTSSVSILNGTTLGAVKSIQIGDNSDSIIVDDSAHAVYVANHGYDSDDVSVLNETTLKVANYLSWDSGPSQVAWDSSNDFAYVTTQSSGQVIGINASADVIRSETTLYYDLTGVAVDPPTRQLIVACMVCAQVYFLNLTSGSRSEVNVGLSPYGVAFDRYNGRVYVTNPDGSPVNGSDYYEPGGVSVINATTEAYITTIPTGPILGVGDTPYGIAVDPSIDRIYVSQSGCLCQQYYGSVIVINGSSDNVSNEIQDWAEPGPSAAVVDPLNHYLYVTDYYLGVVWVFNTSNWAVVGGITVGEDPLGIVADTSDGFLYVTNLDSNNVTVIDGSDNRLVGSISVGVQPWGIALDPLDNEIFVANLGSGTITIIHPVVSNYSIAFEERGLPVGTNWSVRLGAEQYASTASAVDFVEPNGTYSYTLSDVAGWHQGTIPYAGNVTVDGSSISEPTLQFSRVTYAITFTEAALQPGLNWSVTLNLSTLTSQSATIKFLEPNGTYGFQVNASGIWSAEPAFGNVTVNGSSVNRSILFYHFTVPLVLAINWTVASGSCGSESAFSITVQFFGSVSGGDPPYMFNWTFGPGSQESISPDPRHTYNSTGSPIATLSVTDASGDRATKTVNVTWSPPPCAPVGGSSSDPWLVYGVLLGLTALVIAVASVVVWRRTRPPPNPGRQAR